VKPRTGRGCNSPRAVMPSSSATTGSRPDGVVEQLRLSGAGHGWPGVEVRWLRRRLIGTGSSLVNASEGAWAFAPRFSR
jgi:poly(3-hydroxybutyrate) depolymerase